MLLRNITKHVNDQNWFAVFIDFFIVVVGVFVGLQVANWNAERQERKVEARIIDRLHNDVATLISERTAIRKFSTQIMASMDGAARTLFDIDDKADLTPLECYGIAVSHLQIAPPDDLPVIEEMLSTGQIDIIRDRRISLALSDFIRARDQGRNTLGASRANIHQMGTTHPNLLAVKLVANDTTDELVSRAKCDVDGMRRDQSFLNQLVANRQKFSGFYKNSFIDVDVPLASLQDEIERKLGPHKHDAKETTP